MTNALQKFRVFDNDHHPESDKSVNRWIVSSVDFVEHSEPAHAKEEHQRLSSLFPERHFRIYRVKSVTVPTAPAALVANKTPGDGW